MFSENINGFRNIYNTLGFSVKTVRIFKKSYLRTQKYHKKCKHFKNFVKDMDSLQIHEKQVRFL